MSKKTRTDGSALGHEAAKAQLDAYERGKEIMKAAKSDRTKYSEDRRALRAQGMAPNRGERLQMELAKVKSHAPLTAGKNGWPV